MSAIARRVNVDDPRPLANLPKAEPLNTRAEIAEWRARVEALEARVASLEATARRHGVATADGLLLALAAAVGRAAFSTAEVLAHAAVDVELGEVLRAAGMITPRHARRLGKYLYRHRGVRVGDRELARIGQDRQGAVWCFVKCEF